MRKKLILITLCLLNFSIFAEAKTGIDYDMSRGTKPLEPLFNYKSKLKFEANVEGVKSHFSQFEIEEQKNQEKVMILRLTESNALKHEFVDFDLSGTFESWKMYELGFVVAEARLDESKNIILEKTIFDKEGNILEVLRDENKQGFLSERSIYESGKIVKTEKDKDGDGLFEEEIIYNLNNVASIFTTRIEAVTLKTAQRIYIGGLYNHGDIISLNQNLTGKIFEYLDGNTANKIDDVAAYQKIIFAEESSGKAEIIRKYPNRFAIYRAIAQKDGNKSDQLPKIYVVSGDVFESRTRVSIYYRLLGPTPVENIASGSVHLAAQDFNLDSAAEQIAADILEKFPAQQGQNLETPAPVATEKTAKP